MTDDPDMTDPEITETEESPKRLERLRQLGGSRTSVAALLIAVAAAFGIGFWLAPASADDPAETASADMAYLLDHEPGDDPGRAEIRQDFKDARELDPGDRLEAMKDLRERALDGRYGDRVGMRFERRGDHHAAFVALLPDEMQADLKDARESDDPRAELDAIREKALDGAYGEKAKEAFEILEKHRGDGPPHP